jgi:hypothetical protein
MQIGYAITQYATFVNRIYNLNVTTNSKDLEGGFKTQPQNFRSHPLQHKVHVAIDKFCIRTQITSNFQTYGTMRKK